MSTDPVPVYNPGFVCTLATCDVKIWGYIKYLPSLPGNVLFFILFCIIGITQIYFGIRYKTAMFCSVMTLGLFSEGTGYIARMLVYGNPFVLPYFLMYLICLTLGPVFFAAAIYLCLGHVVVVYGESISRIKSRIYTILLMSFDVVSLLLQAIGGGIAASVPFTNEKLIDLGTHILVAGLSFQVASLFAFSCCSLEFFWHVRSRPNLRTQEHMEIAESKKFKWFLRAFALATLLLFIRTLFRSVELSEGFGGKPANSEVQFMILDGTMMILVCSLLTIFHPGIGFQGKWRAVSFPWKGERTEEWTMERIQPRAKIPKVYAKYNARQNAGVEIGNEMPKTYAKYNSNQFEVVETSSE